LAYVLLAYTEYKYDNIEVSSIAVSGPATGPTVPGGRADLYDEVATVTCTITNCGEVDGAEIAQLYLTLPPGAPDAPPRQLRGFDKIKLKAGETGVVAFTLRKRDLGYWDTVSQNWIVPAGEFSVGVGASSRDIRLTSTITVA
jgi:beta-glucosidase